jgi:uncharacterized protein YcbK (DUF882 family)
MKLTNHLDTDIDTRLVCRCGCGYGSKELDWNIDLLIAFEIIRSKLCFELEQEIGITINSGCRCKSHNATIPNASPNSYHCKGMALDLLCPKGVNYETFYNICEEVIGEKGGIGKYTNKNFVHIDVRGKRKRWGS